MMERIKCVVQDENFDSMGNPVNRLVQDDDEVIVSFSTVIQDDEPQALEPSNDDDPHIVWVAPQEIDEAKEEVK